MRHRLAPFVCLYLLDAGAAGASADTAKGAVSIRVSDPASSRCINISTDRVWLTMRRLVTKPSHPPAVYGGPTVPPGLTSPALLTG